MVIRFYLVFFLIYSPPHQKQLRVGSEEEIFFFIFLSFSKFSRIFCCSKIIRGDFFSGAFSTDLYGVHHHHRWEVRAPETTGAPQVRNPWPSKCSHSDVTRGNGSSWCQLSLQNVLQCSEFDGDDGIVESVAFSRERENINEGLIWTSMNVFYLLKSIMTWLLLS